MPLVLSRRWTLRNEFFISARPSGGRDHLRSTDIHLVCQSRTHLLVCVRDACRCVCLRASCSRLAGWCTPSRAAARSVLDGRSPETLDTGCRPNKLNACARQTDPGDERAHGARLTRGSAASNDRTGTSLSSCSDLPLSPLATKSSLLPVYRKMSPGYTLSSSRAF